MNLPEVGSRSILKACYFWMRTDSNIRSKKSERYILDWGADFLFRGSGNFGETWIHLISTTKPVLRNWNFQSMLFLTQDRYKKSDNKNFKIYVGLRCGFFFSSIGWVWVLIFTVWTSCAQNANCELWIRVYSRFTVEKHRKHSPWPSKCLGDPMSL